jgi:hypothetical protein
MHSSRTRCRVGIVLVSTACGGSADDASVGSSSQLVGSWYRAADDQQTAGLEFAADGKVKVTDVARNGRLRTITCDWAVIDGGRIRIASPSGRTEVARCRR